MPDEEDIAEEEERRAEEHENMIQETTFEAFEAVSNRNVNEFTERTDIINV